MQKFLFTPDKHIGFERRGSHLVPLHDPAAIAAMMAFAADFKPDIWIEGGDNLDCGPVSHWLSDKKLSAADLDLRRDVETYTELVLEPLSKLKLTRKVWMIGNHEGWLTQLAEREPGLRHLLDVRHLLPLKGWDVIPQGGVVTLGKLHFIHGDTLRAKGKNNAEAAVTDYEHSIRFGHFHTYRVASKYGALTGEVKTGVSVPGLCRRNPGYLKNAPNQWSQGFCWGYIHDDGTFNDYVSIITKGRFTAHGLTYQVPRAKR